MSEDGKSPGNSSLKKLLKIILIILAAIFTVVYLLWPFDLVTDAIPIVGYLDDIVLISIEFLAFLVGLKKERAVSNGVEKLPDEVDEPFDYEEEEEEEEQE
jgi:uncharacterized membrane protein YkvA (DUF1232 family)